MIGRIPSYVVQPVYKTSEQMKKNPNKSSDNPKKTSKKTNKTDFKKTYHYNDTDRQDNGFSAYA